MQNVTGEQFLGSPTTFSIHTVVSTKVVPQQHATMPSSIMNRKSFALLD